MNSIVLPKIDQPFFTIDDSMKLRTHQVNAFDQINEAIAQGHNRPLLAACTSFGKTRIAAAILLCIQEMGLRGVFICDRIKLIDQTLIELDQAGINFGVVQGNHPLTNPDAPIQICSAQTLARRDDIYFDLAIIDECHTQYQSLIDLIQRNSHKIIIGLSATPYSKGLGKTYNALLVPVTPAELLEQGYLCPVKYYGGREVDTSKVKTKALPTGGREFDDASLAAAAEKDEGLVGALIGNWQRFGENSQTIAFCSSIKQSKWFVERCRLNGITSEHIDGYDPHDLRDQLYRDHDAGKFKILSCSRLLNTGYDAPQVRCLIDCYPAKSLIAYVQRAGRLMRICEGKPYAIYLDHAGNVNRHGYAEDIVPTHLDDGTKKFAEAAQVEKKEPKISTCPECNLKMSGVVCAGCGYEIPIREAIETDGSTLVEMKKLNKESSTVDKAAFFGELKYYVNQRGQKEGRAAHLFREKFGVWPNAHRNAPLIPPTLETLNYIKSRQIAYSKRRNS